MHLVAIGGSDAGISAALVAREMDPSVDVTVIVADQYPNFSICGIPYYVSGDVEHWKNLAHRTVADLEATGMSLRLNTLVTDVFPQDHLIKVINSDGQNETISYDVLVIGTGAKPVVPSFLVDGDLTFGPHDGVHLLHSMDDMFAVVNTLESHNPRRAVIVGAGYIGIEMAEALVARGVQVVQVEAKKEVFPSVDSELGVLVRSQLENRGVEVNVGTLVRAVKKAEGEFPLQVLVERSDGDLQELGCDMVLVVVGVLPDASLAEKAGAALDNFGAVKVDRFMRTNLSDIYAAGDCASTYHRLLGDTYLPLGTTAHKQGRVAGANALGHHWEFAGSTGTQVVKIFDRVVARTGLKEDEARRAGFDPVSVMVEVDDHKAYYPGSRRVCMRLCADRASAKVLGVQMFGHKDSEVAKRIDTASAAIFSSLTVLELSDLDLSYTPPLGSPWDILQVAAQAWWRKFGVSKA